METNEAAPKINLEKWNAFWKMLKEANPSKWLLLLAVILGLLEIGAGLIVPLFTMSLVDQLASSSLEISLIIFLAAAFIIQTISSGFSFYFMTYIGEDIVASIRKRLWEHILFLPVPFFDDQQSGETMSRVTQDTNIIKTLITQHLITFFTGIISVIGSIILLLMIDWKMTLIMILSVPISILLIMPLGQKMYKISMAAQDEMAHFSGNLGRVLSDIRLVKAYHAEETEKAKGENGINHLFQFGLKEAKILAVISPFITFVIMLVLVVLIGYGGVQVASGALTAGALVAIIIYMFQIVVPFTQMASFFTAFQKALGATERIQQILGYEKEKSGEILEAVNELEDLSINKLTFSYKDSPIIKDICLTIPAGKTTAIVGPSGSGKTTLFALLERFYKPDSGEILFGNRRIDQFHLQSWRSQFGYVSQESPLMSGTIRKILNTGLIGKYLRRKLSRLLNWLTRWNLLLVCQMEWKQRLVKGA